MIIGVVGFWVFLVVCFIIFVEMGLLVGFLLLGDIFFIIVGLFIYISNVFGVNIWVVLFLIVFFVFIGGEVGYLIGYKGGFVVFEWKELGLFSRKNVECINVFFECFGGFMVIFVCFVFIVCIFVLVVVGVGYMFWCCYFLYNFIGVMIWGFGLMMVGYFIVYILWVWDLVVEYIDIIFLIVVGGIVLVIFWYYFVECYKVKKVVVVGEDVVIDYVEVEEFVFDVEVFDCVFDLDGDGKY